MKTIAKIIRVITIPPFMALFLYSVLYFCIPLLMSGISNFIAAILSYVVLPVISYPLCFFVKKLKKGGRKTERKTAVILSVTGYIFNTVYLFLFGGSRVEWVVCLTYLISGIVIALCSLLKFKASGHTCGFSGPITCLTLAVSKAWAIGYILLIPIIWASIKTKRHTLLQLSVGIFIPIAVNIILWNLL